MHKAQTIRARAFDKDVVHEIVATTLLLVLFAPVSTNSNDLERVFRQRNNIRELNPSRFAVFALVFKARQVQINQHFKQKDLAGLIRWLYARYLVNRSLDLTGVCGRRH